MKKNPRRGRSETVPPTDPSVAPLARGTPRPTPLEELQEVLSRYDCEIDEPETIPFMAALREQGVLSRDEWTQVLRWFDDAMSYLRQGMPKPESGALCPDADPRNADWVQTIRAQRLAGHRTPVWASLWLWRIGHDREDAPFWKQVGTVAQAMGFPRFTEGSAAPK